MNGALVVVSHPDPASLNHALAKAVVDAWESLGFKTRFVDLHALGFDPVMSPEEARGLRDRRCKGPGADCSSCQKRAGRRCSPELLGFTAGNDERLDGPSLRSWCRLRFCEGRG